MHRDWLKAGLTRPGKSQVGLSRHLKVSEAKVSRWVNGQTRMRADDLNRIAEYLGTTLPRVELGAMVSVVSIPVQGVVQVGFWREEQEANLASKALQIAETPAIKDMDVYALEVRSSESTEDHHVVCAKVETIGRPVRDGDRIHWRETHGTAKTLFQDRIGIVTHRGSALYVTPIDQDGAAAILLSAISVRGVIRMDTHTYKL